MALQVIQKTHPNLLREYEQDLLRGSEQGFAVIADTVPLNSDAESIIAVRGQIQLLRKTRTYGVGSYFAYRMGVLAAMTADVMLPYGFAWTPQEQALRDRIAQDIDERLDSFRYNANPQRRAYLRNVQAYFQERRTFFLDNKTLIADDYATGDAYNGYLSNAAPAYFQKAVEAVADVWFTVLRTEPDPNDEDVSRTLLTWYFVREIEYLLTVKKNLVQTDVTYANFAKTNPGIMAAYERVGDLYYAFGTDPAIDRAVREWRVAHGLGGANRDRAGKKLANHYLIVGRRLLEAGVQPRAKETDLPNALQAFQDALYFDRGNQDAATGVQDTNRAIEERRELHAMYLEIIANAERVREEAGRAFTEGDYGTAITTFRKAVSLFETVGDDFEKLAVTAREGASAVKKDVAKVVQTVIDKATEAIDAGDRAREDRKYDEAVRLYGQVEIVLSEIPADEESPTLAEDKAELLQMAQDKTAQAKREQADAIAREREAAAEAARRPAGQPAPR
ncbi:MAG TPA: hypothetical protein PKI11_17615 [Candidatus Hydrogenedentes bacterium]|nr:hypothetical protein [Candidatus Hydrogenedentota bacterium]